MFLNLTLGYLLFTLLYVACFALSLTVCGLYGHDLTRAREAGVDPDTKWVSYPSPIRLSSSKVAFNIPTVTLSATQAVAVAAGDIKKTREYDKK